MFFYFQELHHPFDAYHYFLSYNFRDDGLDSHTTKSLEIGNKTLHDCWFIILYLVVCPLSSTIFASWSPSLFLPINQLCIPCCFFVLTDHRYSWIRVSCNNRLTWLAEWFSHAKDTKLSHKTAFHILSKIVCPQFYGKIPQKKHILVNPESNDIARPVVSTRAPHLRPPERDTTTCGVKLEDWQNIDDLKSGGRPRPGFWCRFSYLPSGKH